MLRRMSALALALTLVAAVAVAADPPSGKNWLLSQITPNGEVAQCILTLEEKDGKHTPVLVWAPANVKIEFSDFRHGDHEVSFTMKTTRTLPARGDQPAREMPPQTQSFIGTLAGEGKAVLGNLGDDRFVVRAKATPTDKTKLEPNEIVSRGEAVAPYQKAIQLANRPTTLMMQAQRETDAEKKKELQQQAAEARKALEGVAALYREAIEKHAEAPAALDAALALLRGRHVADAAEAGKLLAMIEKQSAPYGVRLARFNLVQAAELAAARKELAAAALPAIEPIAKALTDKDKAAEQVRLLNVYKSALEAAGRAGDVKGVDERLAKLEAILDQEYLATVPPFKPEPYAGRKEKGANQVVAFELFTGAQCPPCVAADVGFDALEKAYSPKDVILIQYHMHIPGPDPLTNPDSVARWDYYKAKFPEGIRGTPSTLFNGKPAAGGGGPMANAETKHKQYRGIIDPLLEKTSPVAIAGKASRNGDKVEIVAEVTGAEPAGEDLRLRFLLVEEKVKYVGGNGLRFHHQVVRGLPGGPAGFVIKDKNFRQAATADLGAIRNALGKYLDDYSAEKKNTWKAKPMELGHLKVVALVQNDESREILQAAVFDLEGKPDTAGK